MFPYLFFKPMFIRSTIVIHTCVNFLSRIVMWTIILWTDENQSQKPKFGYVVC